MTLNWLVVGVGDITSRRVIPAILDEERCRLAGLVTRDISKAKPYDVPAWTDLQEALQSTQAQAVYIGTPVALHAPQSICSLRAGKHVLCEKPMAMNYAQAAEMQDAAVEAGRILGVSYYRRLFPKIQRAKQLLDTGAVGRPVLCYCTCHNWTEPLDGFRGWLIDPTIAGGGPLYDIASHRIDLLNYLFGKPVRAIGSTSNVIHQTAVEDNATALIDYENGVRGIVDVRWHSRMYVDEFRIYGTDGELDLTPLAGPEVSYPGGKESLPAHENFHFPLIADFTSAVLEGTALQSSGASALPTDWVTEQVVRGRQFGIIDSNEHSV